MDNNELVDSSILYNHAMDNCEHIDTSAEDDKNLALVVDICGEHLVKMGKLFSFF